MKPSKSIKPSKHQRKAYKTAIEAVAALAASLYEGDDRETATRVCDELLTLRYGPISPVPAD